MTLERDFENQMRQVLGSGHSTRDGADAPPADTWQRVLARIQALNEEEKPMDTATFATPMNTPISIPTAVHQRSLGRYLNIAATVALVLTIALGGWLAAIRMNQPGDPDPRFAVLPATPLVDQGQTCDVEPLSVDRVMEIVKNPGYFMLNGAAGPRSDSPGMGSPEGAELWKFDESLDLVGSTSAPTREQFDSVEDFANEYMSCMVFGTQAQAWTFYSPASIQASILSEFQVFADEETVRARVEERAVLPAYTGEEVWNYLGNLEDVSQAVVNPDAGLAIVQASNSLYFDQVMTIGWVFTDADGKQLVLSNGTGRNLIPESDLYTSAGDGFLNVVIAKNRGSDVWMVIPGMPPQLDGQW